MRYKFDAFILDTDRFELSRNGEALNVEPQVIELLILLIENRDRMISRDEINEKIWKGRVVSEAALSSRIKIARQVLGDDGRKQQFIRTVHKKGFSFVAEVEEEKSEMPDVAEISEHFSNLEQDNTGNSISHSKPTIAVLAFSNLSNDPEQEYFSDGITEDIITGLSQFSTLSVVARHSSFVFKGEKVDIKEVGEKLGVQYVVEGSVRRVDNRVRITAQLIGAESGNHIWAERYDRELEDIFAVQDEVTRSIVAVLVGRVQEDVVERALRKPTDNMKAYELMLQGKSLRDRLSAEAMAQARGLFEKAIELDPMYARAYMYLSDTYVVDIWLGLAQTGTPELTLQLARKAVALDSNDVFVQDHLGYTYLCTELWEDAEVQFDNTLSKIVNEAESMAWCGYAFLALGRHEKALDVVLEASRLDPLHPNTFEWILGQVYYFAKRYDDVIRVLMGEALLNSMAHAFQVGAYAQLGRSEEAHSALATFVRERRREFNSRDIVVESDTIESLAGGYRKVWRLEADWDHLADGLRKAGLPD